MKKAKFLKVSALIALIAVICLALCACDGNAELNYQSAEAYSVADSGAVAANTVVTDLEIDWISGDVIIEASDTATALEFNEVVTEGSVTRDTTLHYLIERNILHIKYAKSGRIKLGNLKKDLHVRVPANYSLLEIEVECTSGAIDVDCDASKIEVESVAGAVDISANAQRIDVESVSGNVSVACNTSLYELDVETVTGNVRLILPQDKGFFLEFDTATGLLYNAFSAQTTGQGRYYTYRGGGCAIDVDTSTGSLTLEKAAE